MSAGAEATFHRASCTLGNQVVAASDGVPFRQERRPTRVCRTPGAGSSLLAEASTLRAEWSCPWMAPASSSPARAPPPPPLPHPRHGVAGPTQSKPRRPHRQSRPRPHRPRRPSRLRV